MGIKTPLVGLGMQPPQALGDTPLRIRETAPWEGGRYQKLVAMEEAMMGITRWVPPGTTGAGGASSAGKASVPSVLKTEDDRRNLCMQFALCESEAQVIQVLKHHGLWDDVSLWRYYGDRPNNFSVVGNQQAKPEAALVEKVTNAIDAVLMGECLRQGLHPEGSGAPATIREAVRNFFGVRDGELANLSAVERTELASRIMVVASGRKTSPCFSIIDTGEGQSPEQLPETLLSLNSTNKLRIHFVHGQFNQGGSGALPFCGDHNVQLIISRRDPEICRQRGDNDSWGFTILRRFDPAGGEKSSSYRYLTVGGAIPSFSGGTPLPLLPGDYPVAHALTFEHGTFIKLFDYKIGTKLRTNAVRDLTSRLSTLIPGAALPVRVLERRNGYQDRTEATLSGLNVRLAEDVNRILEPGFPASMSIHIDRQELGISIYAFKGDVAQDYVDGEGVIFTVSGHTHGSLPRAFFGRKTVGKGFLANSLLVVVDASKLVGRSREDLFLTSRDRLREGALRNQIVAELERLIRDHPGLKQLQTERRQQHVQNAVGDDRPLRTVLQDVLFKSPILAQIFLRGERITDPFKIGLNQPQDEFKGKEFPTFFQLQRKFPRNNPKRVSPGGRAKVVFLTDAENSYFNRNRNPGQFEVRINGELVDNADMTPWDGRALLTVPIPEDTPVGATLECECQVSDMYRADPFRETFYIKVVNADDIGAPRGKKRKRNNKTPDGTPGKGAIGQAQFQLPNVQKVHEKDWATHNFDKYSVARVLYTQDGFDVFLNMDNVYLLTELKSKTKVAPDIIKAQWETAMALYVLGAIKRYEELQAAGAGEEGQSLETYVDEVTRSVAPIALPTIEHLGSLQMPEGD